MLTPFPAATEDRLIKICLLAAAIASLGAVHRTPNFVVRAATPEIAEEVATVAERCRRELALAWFGEALPHWDSRCLITVKVNDQRAGGRVSFAFEDGRASDWRMSVHGPLDRILESVLPHEITHAVFATYFGAPLPRWADEGAATLAEHESEKRRLQLRAEQLVQSRDSVALRTLLAMEDYPDSPQHIFCLYAAGHSLSDFLVQNGGKPRYIQFLKDAQEHGWDHAVQDAYGDADVESLEQRWHAWVAAGHQPPAVSPDRPIADASSRTPKTLSAASLGE